MIDTETPNTAVAREYGHGRSDHPHGLCAGPLFSRLCFRHQLTDEIIDDDTAKEGDLRDHWTLRIKLS